MSPGARLYAAHLRALRWHGGEAMVAIEPPWEHLLPAVRAAWELTWSEFTASADRIAADAGDLAAMPRDVRPPVRAGMPPIPLKPASQDRLR